MDWKEKLIWRAVYTTDIPRECVCCFVTLVFEFRFRKDDVVGGRIRRILEYERRTSSHFVLGADVVWKKLRGSRKRSKHWRDSLGDWFFRNGITINEVESWVAATWERNALVGTITNGSGCRRCRKKSVTGVFSGHLESFLSYHRRYQLTLSSEGCSKPPIVFTARRTTEGFDSDAHRLTAAIMEPVRVDRSTVFETTTPPCKIPSRVELDAPRNVLWY